MAGHSKAALPAACLLAAGAVCSSQMVAFTAVPRAASARAPQVHEATGARAAAATGTAISPSVASCTASASALAAAALVGNKVAAKKLRTSERKAARQTVAMQAGHAVIVQNKGGGHGEVGYHLALALQAKGLLVTILQEAAAKKNQVPYSLYDSNLSEAAITWVDPADAEAYSAATAVLKNGPPVTHIFDNYSKKPEQIEPLLALAKASKGFKLYSFISSAGMYTSKGELNESLAVKDPPTGQRLVEMKLSKELPGKWASFRPQYIYGPYTNKRAYLDWFLARAARGLPMPVPGDASQPVNVAHCEDVAALVSGVVGREASAGGEVFNCGTESQVTYKQLCEAAGEAVGKPAKVVSLPVGTKTSFPFRPNAEGFYVNVDKAKKLLGFSAKHNVLKDISASGFYTALFNTIGLGQGDLDTSKDLPEGMSMPAVANTSAEDLAYKEGQHVVITIPPGVAGVEGTVLGPVWEKAFAIKLDNGNVFHLPVNFLSRSNLKDGQRVSVLAPAVLQGKVGTVVGPPVSNGAVAVRVDTEGVKYLVSTKDLVEDSSTAAPVAAASATPTPVAEVPSATNITSSTDEEELEFQPGEKVTLLGPPAMAGKSGTIIGPALSDSFAVRFDTGSIFDIATANIQGASGAAPAPAAAASVSTSIASPMSTASSPENEELEFQAGQKVTLLGPPAMAGKGGTIVGPALSDSFAVMFDSGSVFNIASENIQDASGASPAAAATAPVSTPVATTAEDEELEFQPGESVTLLGPPALAGKSGTIVGPALGNAFAVRFDTGSVFNIALENIQGASGAVPAPATPAPIAAAPVSTLMASSSAGVVSIEGEELEFSPGQRVTLLAPPAMAGMSGAIVGPALSDSFAVCFDSGSVFNIATANIQVIEPAMA